MDARAVPRQRVALVPAPLLRPQLQVRAGPWRQRRRSMRLQGVVTARARGNRRAGSAMTGRVRPRPLEVTTCAPDALEVLASSLAVAALLACSPSPPGAAVAHIVAPGETLWSIAAANNLTTRTVAAYNGLSEDSQVVLGQTIQVPTDGRGLRRAAEAGLARRPLATPAAPRRRHGRARPHDDRRRAGPRRRAPTTCAPATRSARLAASSGVSLESMAAMNGLDPDGAAAGRHRAQAADRRARAAARLRAGARADASSRTPTRCRPPTRLGAADIQSVASQLRRLPLAGGRDRVAGERLQQRDGVLGQRARRDAGHAGHVGLRRSATSPAARWTRPRRPTTSTPACCTCGTCSQRDRRRRGAAIAGYYQGLGSVRRAGCTTTRSSTSPTCRRCARRFGG